MDEDVPFLLEWRTVCDYLWGKWRDLIYAPAWDAASATGGGRAVPKRDRVEFVQEALRELIKWRIIPDPFVIKDQDSSHDLARAEATKADAETVKKAVEAEAERGHDEHGKDEYMYYRGSLLEPVLPRGLGGHALPQAGGRGERYAGGDHVVQAQDVRLALHEPRVRQREQQRQQRVQQPELEPEEHLPDPPRRCVTVGPAEAAGRRSGRGGGGPRRRSPEGWIPQRASRPRT